MMNRLRHELRLIYSTKEQSQNGKRLTGLDMARGIAIILVVIGHSGFVGPACNIWISTFHLPTFFLLSGILIEMQQEDTYPLSKLAKQKARSIMLPYLWFSLGSICLDILQVLLGNFTWNTVWEHTVQTLTLQGYSVLWFLPVLYLSEIIVVLIIKVIKHFIPSGYGYRVLNMIAITLLAVCGYCGYKALITSGSPVFALHIARICGKSFIGAAFMSYGYVFSRLYSRNTATAKMARGRCCTFLSGALLSTVNLIVLSKLPLLDLNNLNLQNPGIYLLLGTTGGIGCILLCISIPNIPFLTFYGQNSLIIMCTHMNFYVMYFSMLFNLFLVPRLPGANDIVYAVFSLVGTFVLSIPVVLIIRTFFPFVLGRKRIKNKKMEEKKLVA